MLFILMGSTNGEQRMATASIVLLLWLRSLPVVGMLICLTFGFGVFLRQPTRTGKPWVNGILACSLVVGNLYKVHDLAQWFLEKTMVGFSGILGNLGWLDQGYWLSPLSWLNPYKNLSGGTMVVQALICVGAALAGIGIGLKGYGQRRIGQMP